MKTTLSFLMKVFLLPLFISGCSDSVNNEPHPSEFIQPFAENPYYLAWGDVPVFLLGATNFHSWTPISRPENVDFIAHMDRLKNIMDDIGSPHVMGFMRVLPYDPNNHLHDGPVERVLQPWLQLEDGRFDLSRFEPEWEERLTAYLDAALARKIIISLEIWDDWSVTRGVGGAWDPGEHAGWNAHPFNPENNINYDESVLSQMTSECNAPFYNTIYTSDSHAPAAGFQKLYVDRLLEIAVNYPNIIINISNESRATLEWSRYWAEYIRERVPKRFLIGDMPSTNRMDGGGECEDEFSPATLAVDPMYDFVDIAQGVSAHEFGSNIADQALGGSSRIREYRRLMREAAGPKPLVTTKDYTRGPDGGDAILWSRFIGGASAARFHRPSGDATNEMVDFQHEAVARIGNFIAGIPFWTMHPAPELIQSTDETPQTNILIEHGGHVVIQILEAEKDQKLLLNLNTGTWTARWIDPSTGQEIGRSVVTSENDQLEIPIAVHADHQVLHLKPGINSDRF